MLLETVLAVWLSAQTDSRDCFIFGEVSAAEEQVFNLQATGCPIKIERKGKLVTLTSPKYIVEITIPDGPGAQKFLYQWGETHAKIGDQDVDIAFHPVGGG